jgi:release factor glutamine methyltransferase
MRINDILNEATLSFEAMGSPTPRLDAEILLALCLDCDRMEFLKNPGMAISPAQLADFQALVARRRRWEPVAYITGRKEFWAFSLEVSRDVLIPRPDTEIIVEEALDICRKTDSPELRIADIGTGSGAIALALAKELAASLIVATDISAAALAQAKRNAGALNLESRIDFRQGDLFEPVDGLFDMIISNPPYISVKDYENLPDGVKAYEPSMALLAGETGLEFYEKLIHQAVDYLQKNGWILLEIGATQDKDVCAMMHQTGFYESIAVRADYAGLPRVIKARRKHWIK